MIEYIVDRVNTNGIIMGYEKFGNGKKNLVILPGLSIKPVTESASAVAEAFSKFTETYTVYVFDRRLNIKKTIPY